MLTELERSQVEVQRCSLSSEGPRLRSSGVQCAQTLAVEVQQCPLRAEVGEQLGEELAGGSEHGSGGRGGGGEGGGRGGGGGEGGGEGEGEEQL